MQKQSGNMLIYILGAIFLLGLLIVLVKGSFQEGSGIDADKVVLKAQQVQAYASELERGVTYVLREGVSETDLRFAATGASAIYGVYSDATNMVFAPTGGGVEYKSPPTGINDGRKWGFYATTHLTDLGTDTAGSQKAELVTVLPNVTQAFCDQINRNVKQSIDLTLVTDPTALGCVFTAGEEFAGTFRAGAAVNLLDDTKVPTKPAREACVRCNDGTFQYYRVLLAR